MGKCREKLVCSGFGLSVVSCLLSVVCCLLSVVSCKLSVVCCLLWVAEIQFLIPNSIIPYRVSRNKPAIMYKNQNKYAYICIKFDT